METNFTLRQTEIHDWHFLLISGFVFLSIGIVVMMAPIGFFIALSLLLSLAFLAGGAAEIWRGFSIGDRDNNWRWPVTRGVIAMIAGLVLLAKPKISMIIIPFLAGILALVKSVGLMGWSLLARGYGNRAWRWILIAGILGGILALVVILNPGVTGFVIAIIAALSFIATGIFQIWFAFQLRNHL